MNEIDHDLLVLSKRVELVVSLRSYHLGGEGGKGEGYSYLSSFYAFFKFNSTEHKIYPAHKCLLRG